MEILEKISRGAKKHGGESDTRQVEREELFLQWQNSATDMDRYFNNREWESISDKEAKENEISFANELEELLFKFEKVKLTTPEKLELANDLKNLADWLNQKHRAPLINKFVQIYSEGLVEYSPDEQEKYKKMNSDTGKSAQNLDQIGEYQEMLRKHRWVEQIFNLPLQWRKINYEPFDPELELIKAKGNKEGRKERVEEYKLKLEKQKKAIADLISNMQSAIKGYPGIESKRLHDFVYLKAPELRLTPQQISKFERVIIRYVDRYHRIKEFKKKYSEDDQLFQACFGIKPHGKIEIINRDVVLYFRCYDIKDYAYIFNHKNSVQDSTNYQLSDSEIKRAEKSGGCYLPSGNPKELSGCIAAENASMPLTRSQSNEIQTHEVRHAINNLFQDISVYRDDYPDLKDIINATPEEQEYLLIKNLRGVRKGFEKRLKNEIIAFFKEGHILGHKLDKTSVALKNILIKKDFQGGLYDYYGQWRRGEGNKLEKELISAGMDNLLVQDCFQQVFFREYNYNLERAIEALVTLKFDPSKKTRDEIINLLINTPLSQWPKITKRFHESK